MAILSTFKASTSAPNIYISRYNFSPLLLSSVPKGLLGIFTVTQVRIFTVIFPPSLLHPPPFCIPTFNHSLVLFLHPLSNLLLFLTILHAHYPKSQTLIALLTIYCGSLHMVLSAFFLLSSTSYALPPDGSCKQ